MSAWVEGLNAVGGRWAAHAAEMVWQVGLLVSVLWVLELWLARRVRAVIRHGLWLLLPLKLMLPPTLALPTSPAYWMRIGPGGRASETGFTVRVTHGLDDATLDAGSLAGHHSASEPGAGSSRAILDGGGGLLAAWLAGVVVLLGVLGRRAASVRRMVSRSEPAPEEVVRRGAEAARRLGLRAVPQLRTTTDAGVPSVCGLVRPVILLPSDMLGRLSDDQWEGVLLHELAHVKRGDLWINHLQAVLQVLYWWHPLVWWGNARLRQVREEATDEVVVVARDGEAADYAGTLVAVARAGLSRERVTMGLVGILESRRALRRRVERLLELPAPSRSGCGAFGWAFALAAALVVLPMGWDARATAAEGVEEQPLLLAPDPSNDEVRDVRRDTMRNNIPAIRIEAQTAVEQNRENLSGPRAIERSSLQDESKAVDFASGNQTGDGVTKTNEPARLVTRQYRLNPRVVAENLREANVPGVSPDAGLGPRLIAFLAAFGLSTNPPNAVFYSEDRGLLVRADEASIAIVDQALDMVSEAPAMITVEAMFLSVDEDVIQRAGWTWMTRPASDGSRSAPRLTLAQARVVRQNLRFYQDQGRVRVLAAPRITTLSGRQASIETEGRPPVGAGGGSGRSREPGSDSQLPRLVLDVVATHEDDRTTLSMTTITRVTERLDSRDGRAAEGVPGKVDDGTAETDGIVRVQASGYVEHTATSANRLWDGQSVILSLGREAGSIGNLVSRRDDRPWLLVLVTVRLTDPAGNPVHSDEALGRMPEEGR